MSGRNLAVTDVAESKRDRLLVGGGEGPTLAAKLRENLSLTPPYPDRLLALLGCHQLHLFLSVAILLCLISLQRRTVHWCLGPCGS